MSRFTVRGLIVFVGFVALGCAALIKPSEVWVMILLGLTATMLIASPVAALGSSGARRPFWIGFAVVAWSYFLLVRLLASYSFLSNSQATGISVDYFLPTNRLLVYLADHYVDDPWSTPAGMGGGGMGGGFFQVYGSGSIGGTGIFPPGTGPAPGAFPVIGPRASFLLAGHLLWTLLFAYIGGTALRHSYLRKAAAAGQHLPDVPA